MSCALTSEGPTTSSAAPAGAAMSSHQQSLHVVARSATQGVSRAGSQGPTNKWAGISHGMISTPPICAVLFACSLTCVVLAILLQLCKCYPFLQGWLLHKDIQLAAYFPFLKEAGIDSIEVRHPKAILHASRAAMLYKRYIGPFFSKPVTTPFLCLPFVLLKPQSACGYSAASRSLQAMLLLVNSYTCI